MFIFLGMKSIWALSIVLAFVAGSVLTGTISFADDDDSESEVVEALEEVSEQLDELNEVLDEAIAEIQSATVVQSAALNAEKTQIMIKSADETAKITQLLQLLSGGGGTGDE